MSLDLHLVVDNYATHKHAKVKAWLKEPHRFHLHFTPTSASRINLVEPFFGLISPTTPSAGIVRIQSLNHDSTSSDSGY